MNNKNIIIAITLVFVLGFFASLVIIQETKPAKTDMIYINDVVKSVENHVEYSGEKIYDYRVIMMDEPDYAALINRAAARRDVFVDVNDDGKKTGSVIFYLEFDKMMEAAQKALIISVAAVFLLLIFICVLYAIYLQNTFFKPFFKLQRFAKAVAAGNLDMPLDMDKNNSFGAFTESFDIMREELKAARLKELQANNAKRELIASLSHDIKTPVATIKAISELVLAISNDERIKPKIETVYEKAEQIDKLITDMFNTTLDELGVLQISIAEKESTIISELVKSSDYNEQVQMEPVPECIIEVDPLRLGQVFDNIIANSYKYANTKISISFSLTVSHLEMKITDYGKGIADDEMPFIFDKFYRGSNVKTQSGAGLGLYISKHLMESQKGDILCFNGENCFQTFIFIKLA